MKTKVKQITFAIISSIFLWGISSCKEENQVLESMSTHASTRSGDIGDLVTHHFDAQTFAQKIEARLNGKVPGYGYCIVVNGQVAAKNGAGNARYNVDAPQRNYTENVIQDIGSCTKYFAALLAMKYLNSAGAAGITVALEKKVYLYLPYYFQPSNDFKKVTFRDLMAHTSGIINNGSSLGGIQKTAENGINETTDPAPLASPKPLANTTIRISTMYCYATAPFIWLLLKCHHCQ
ncbi:MAG: serine hydrolase domain-containing protein [Spirosomataceae bacterium]